MWGVCIAAAVLTTAAIAYRIGANVDLRQWWVPLAFVSGMAAADFLSGLVHWGADTWGRDDVPLIGPRLLVPFRVHHVNPDDFVERSFLDTNGDVAAVTLPLASGLFAIPLDSSFGCAAAVFGFALCATGMLTNQIHQWAHLPTPPATVRVLQDCGLILGRIDHAVHHDRPYASHYCITTGWCNAPLEAIGFFRGLEAAITRVTGAQPRGDDRRYEQRYGVPARG